MPSTSPKDTNEAEFIKYFNDKTFVFDSDYNWFAARMVVNTVRLKVSQ